MIQKLWTLAAILIFSSTCIAQTNAEKKSIAGTYKAEFIRYGDYYVYDVKKDKLDVEPTLATIIAGNKERLGDKFLESIRIEAEKYAAPSFAYRFVSPPTEILI